MHTKTNMTRNEEIVLLRTIPHHPLWYKQRKDWNAKDVESLLNPLEIHKMRKEKEDKSLIKPIETMKTTSATTVIEVLCKCPYCNSFLDIINKTHVSDALNSENSSKSCNLEIDCEDCKETFIVTDINY